VLLNLHVHVFVYSCCLMLLLRRSFTYSSLNTDIFDLLNEWSIHNKYMHCTVDMYCSTVTMTSQSDREQHWPDSDRNRCTFSSFLLVISCTVAHQHITILQLLCSLLRQPRTTLTVTTYRSYGTRCVREDSLRSNCISTTSNTNTSHRRITKTIKCS